MLMSIIIMTILKSTIFLMIITMENSRNRSYKRSGRHDNQLLGDSAFLKLSTNK